MSPEHIGFALLILGIFLLLGKWIRMRMTSLSVWPLWAS